MKSPQQREGSEPAPGAPSPATDGPTVLSDAPEVLNDSMCATGAGMGPNQPQSALPEEPVELTTADEQQSPVGDPLDFSDVRLGFKEPKKDAQCAHSGAEQAEEATAKEQGTVATCCRPQEAPRPCRTCWRSTRALWRLHSRRHHARSIAFNNNGDSLLPSATP